MLKQFCNDYIGNEVYVERWYKVLGYGTSLAITGVAYQCCVHGMIVYNLLVLDSLITQMYIFALVGFVL